MQLVVVAAIMPSLILLSRTRVYSPLRICAALFAAFAAMGWIADRLVGVRNSIDVIVNDVAHRAGWIAGVLFLTGVVSWSLRYALDKQGTPGATIPADPSGRMTYLDIEQSGSA